MQNTCTLTLAGEQMYSDRSSNGNTGHTDLRSHGLHVCMYITQEDMTQNKVNLTDPDPADLVIQYDFENEL